MSSHFDCIVVGAGPAGLTAALALARAGIEVVVLERGESIGSKNMFGGVLYGRALAKLVPDFWREAPVERPVTRWVLSFLDSDSSFSVDFASTRFALRPDNAFTISRAKFDQWYAQKVEEAGARIVRGTVVDDLLLDKGRVVGVRTGRDQGELYADVVIAADGVNSIVARKARLRRDLVPADVALGVKETLELSEESINKTFVLSSGEGMARTFVGAATEGVPGGGFVYTNRKTVSVGIVATLSSLVESHRRPDDILENFKRHPSVAPLVAGGVLREYAAHLIPETSRIDEAKLFSDGLLVAGDAAGFTLNTGIRLEGANYAILSGLAAAEAVQVARSKRDFSSRGLKVYRDLLEQHGMLGEFRRFRRAHRFLSNRRLYRGYPEAMCALGESMFTAEPKPRKGFSELAKDSLKDRVAFHELIGDAIDGWRGLA